MVIRTIAPEENCPWLGLGFELGLRLVLGLVAIFLGGNCPRTILGTFLSRKNSSSTIQLFNPQLFSIVVSQ